MPTTERPREPRQLIDGRATGETLALLRDGDLEVVGRLVVSSNSALLCRLDGDAAVCIYKPTSFERPLHDFSDGTLGRRETAAYLVSDSAGLGIVPPTILRDGPFGEGAVQLWVTPDEAIDPIELVETDDPRLRPIALFDAVVNNADRKIGHLLPLSSGAILGVDHGICFHAEPKLRTVLWAWRGERFTEAESKLLAVIGGALDGALGVELGELLSEDEVAATRDRVARLMADGRFPQPDPDRPAIPWPPY
ncbi:MAG TPA: SCO1664 family protein [Candidatus Limnocylindrales bacterium]|nr:SCO1664 family protein [Candidatus Limnocylindrales bacterium]